MPSLHEIEEKNFKFWQGCSPGPGFRNNTARRRAGDDMRQPGCCRRRSSGWADAPFEIQIAPYQRNFDWKVLRCRGCKSCHGYSRHHAIPLLRHINVGPMPMRKVKRGRWEGSGAPQMKEPAPHVGAILVQVH